VSFRFVGFIGLRYFRARRRSRGVTSTVLSVVGVAVGVMTLTAVLGVMNGFQLGFIESILEISSYHLQVTPASAAGPELEQELDRLRGLPFVRAAVPFSEQQVIVEGRYAGSELRGCLIRGVPEDVERLDSGFAGRVQMVSGRFSLQSPASVVLGVELARHLGVEVGDTLSVLALEGGSFEGLAPVRLTYVVEGLFRSGYYDFDLGWGFMSLEGAGRLSGASPPDLKIGVKIRNRFRDRAAGRGIQAALGLPASAVGSWREFNRAFFGALRMEKILMMVLVGLIFVVVGFNIHHSLRRAVRERYEEIAVLKALGTPEASLRGVFVLEGLLIGLMGSALGLLLGLLLAANVNEVFSLAEAVVNGVLGLLDRVLFPVMGGGERFSLFSPTYFYIEAVPSRVLPQEAVLIALFALASSTLAAVSASNRVRRVRPAEVLRYE
jgi:lipoprotein-releasing system permease protein